MQSSMEDNPERKPDPTVCMFVVGLTTPPCKKIKLLKCQQLNDALCPTGDGEDKKKKWYHNTIYFVCDKLVLIK